MYPRQAWRLLKDPVKGIFVPLIVCRSSRSCGPNFQRSCDKRFFRLRQSSLARSTMVFHLDTFNPSTYTFFFGSSVITCRGVYSDNSDTEHEWNNTKTLIGHEHSVSCARFMPGDHLIVSACRDRKIRIFDVTSG